MAKVIEQIEKFRRPCGAMLRKVSEIIEYLSDSRLIAGPGIHLQETAAGIVVSTEQTVQNTRQSKQSGNSVYSGPFALSYNTDKTMVQCNLYGAYLHTPSHYIPIWTYRSTIMSVSIASDPSSILQIIYLDIEDPAAPFLTRECGAGGNNVAWHRIPVGRESQSGIEQFLYGSIVYTAQFAEIYG